MDVLEEQEVVLACLDEVYKKFGKFVMETLSDLHIPTETKDSIQFVLDRDVLVVYPKMKAFLEEHEEYIKKRDAEHFRELLPPEFRGIQFDQKIISRGFDFGDALLSLKEDADNCL